MPALQHYFKDERIRRGWSVREAATRSQISVSKAYAIENGDDNVELETFENIATAFSMTPAELATAIGKGQPNTDPIEAAIRQRTAEMRAAVEGTPREFWPSIIKATFDRAIDGARDMAQLLADRPTRERPAKTRRHTPAKAASGHPSYGGDPGPDQLKTRQRVGALVLAGA